MNAATLLALSFAFAVSAHAGEIVRVFVLAGQSNMEGKAPNELFEHQATDPKTRDFFARLRDGDRWVVRDDVYVRFLDRSGPLTLGFGSPGRTGVEFAFGCAMGDRFDEPVILVKAAWGGKSLFRDFRPPSSGMPDAAALEKELADRQRRVKEENEKHDRNDPLPTADDIAGEYGFYYRAMLAEVREIMDRHATMFPALKDRSPELTGFVWFQGWNDQYGSENEYRSHMERFIRDVRRDLDAPNLPVVVAAMGQNGSTPATGAMLTVQQAQLAMNDVPDFAGNVRAIRTDTLVDTAAEALYPKWKEEGEAWKITGGDHPYHYLGSAIWFTRIGRSMADAMAELLPPQTPAKDE